MFRNTVIALVLFIASFTLAQQEAVGSIFERTLTGSLNMICTISVVEYGGEVYGMTAAHCVDHALDEVDDGVWESERDFLVTFDELSYTAVELYRVGRVRRGYDVAVVRFNEPLNIEPLRIAPWESVSVGDRIINYANPIGIGVQRFTGEVTRLSLDRPTPGNTNWRGNAISDQSSAGGSSGSLVLNEDYEVIGVHIGVIVPRNGDSFKIFVPSWKIENFFENDDNAYPVGEDTAPVEEAEPDED